MSVRISPIKAVTMIAQVLWGIMKIIIAPVIMTIIPHNKPLFHLILLMSRGITTRFNMFSLLI